MPTRHTVIRALIADLWNLGSFEQASSALSPDFVYYSSVFPHGLRGLETLKDYILNIREGMPDFRQELSGELIGDGDLIAARWRVQGTQTGDFLGIAATGKPLLLEGVDIYRFVGEQIVEIRSYHDRLTVMQQLGMLPQEEDAV